MKKKFRLMRGCEKNVYLRKTWMIMKLTMFLFFLGIMQMMASEAYSQTTKMTLQLEDVAVKQVLDRIEENSEFFFLYNSKLVDVNRKVDVDAKDQRIDEILSSLFQETGVVYTVVDRQIVLTNKADQVGFIRQSGQQQDKKVTGKVSDARGGSIPGVSVVVKGTTTGVTTNNDGNFSLVLPESAKILVFSFVGMKSQEVAIEEKNVYNVILVDETIGVEEVVVVGYGTQKKLNLTGSVVSMDGDEIAKKPVTQTSMALQGMSSGVTVTQTSGEPGQDGGTIRIRGIGTLGDSNPLVLVDGIKSDINSVDPNDIESISVLKDAASASIYGSRAANGVILITTKRAEKNKFVINYNNYIGFQEATDLPKIVSGYDHMVMMNEANRNVGKPETFKQDYINNYALNFPSDDYPETDWFNEMLKDQAMQQNHHISINGGGEKVSILASISYLDQDGITINTNYKRVNLRVNTDVKLKENLRAGFDVLLRQTDDASPAAGLPWYFLNRYPQNLAGKNGNGTWGVGWDGANDWANETDGGMKHSKNYSVVANINIDWQPFDGLNLNLQYAPERGFDHFKNFSKQVNLYYPNGDLYNPTQFKAKLTEKYGKNIANNFKAVASYTKSYKKSNWSAIAGFEQMEYLNDWMQGYRNEYLLENYEVLDAGSPTNQQATGSASASSLRSIFGRINYNFDQKYLLEANLRYDGSSKFNKGHKYGLFPSFSAGWRITQEEFMKDVHWLDNLKIRASWGQLGNQNIGNYPSSSVVSLGQDYIFNNSVAAQGGAILELANPNISWETTEMTNFGLDVSVFSKLSLSAEYYIKNTNDILLRLPIPMTTGLDPSYQNAGKVQNKGWDFSANYHDKKGGFEYRIGINFSDVKNKIIDLVGTGPYISSRTIQKEGYSIYSLYGLESSGLFQNQAEITGHATQFGTVKPGDIRYVDQITVDSDGDGVLDKTDGVINAQDRVIMGDYIPRYTYGFDLYAKYKNFDISGLFQGIGKVDGYIDGQGVFAFYIGASAREWQKDYWTPENTDATYPRLTFGYPNNEQVSSYWKKSAAYLRLKNVQIGYTIPKSILDKTFLNSCRVFFSGQNLFTIDKFYDGFDPEAPIGTGDFYPMVRVMSFGIDVKF